MVENTYYLLLRPPGPGCQPKRGLKAVEAFDDRRYCPEIGRMAWGRCTYDRELAPSEVSGYDLEPESE